MSEVATAILDLAVLTAQYERGDELVDRLDLEKARDQVGAALDRHIRRLLHNDGYGR